MKDGRKKERRNATRIRKKEWGTKVGVSECKGKIRRLLGQRDPGSPRTEGDK